MGLPEPGRVTVSPDWLASSRVVAGDDLVVSAATVAEGSPDTSGSSSAWARSRSSAVSAQRQVNS